MFLPCSAQLNTTVRNRLGRIDDELSHDDASQRDADTMVPPSPPTVFLDGAHTRCRPEYQKRHMDVVVGKVESPNMSRGFGLVQQAASSPEKQLRHDLIAQGWEGQSKVTAISDGEPGLPNLVMRAVRGSVTHILDWWHISMRVKHIENAVRGLVQSKGFSGLPLLFERPADTLRWYLWHGKVMTAATILNVLQIDCDRLHAETRELREAAKGVRAAQLAHLRALSDQLYPSLRIYLFDARRVFSSPLTVFGPLIATLYLGRHYLAFRDRARIAAFSEHFDWLIREADITARELPHYLDTLNDDTVRD